MLDALRDGQTLDLGGEFFTLTGPVHLRNKRSVTIDNGTLHLPASDHGRNSAVLLVMRCAYVELGSRLVLDEGLRNPRYHPDLEAQHAQWRGDSIDLEDEHGRHDAPSPGPPLRQTRF